MGNNNNCIKRKLIHIKRIVNLKAEIESDLYICTRPDYTCCFSEFENEKERLKTECIHHKNGFCDSKDACTKTSEKQKDVGAAVIELGQFEISHNTFQNQDVFEGTGLEHFTKPLLEELKKLKAEQTNFCKRSELGFICYCIDGMEKQCFEYVPKDILEPTTCIHLFTEDGFKYCRSETAQQNTALGDFVQMKKG